MVDVNTYFGEVIFFDPKKGYGFISWTKNDGMQQKDMFVHYSDINCQGFKTLYKGQKVSFILGSNKHGSPKATNVMIITN